MKAFFSKQKQQDPLPEKKLSQLSLEQEDLDRAVSDKVESDSIPESYDELSINEDDLNDIVSQAASENHKVQSIIERS